MFHYCAYMITNGWHTVDAIFNMLSIQYPLLSMIVFITIWTTWVSFWQIEAWACGKAKHFDILALFALILVKFIYPAKRFIAPAIHLFINWYSPATAHHLPIRYSELKLSVNLGGSIGSNRLGRFRVRVATRIELMQPVLPHENLDCCNGASFATKYPAFQPHNFGSN